MSSAVSAPKQLSGKKRAAEGPVATLQQLKAPKTSKAASSATTSSKAKATKKPKAAGGKKAATVTAAAAAAADDEADGASSSTTATMMLPAGLGQLMSMTLGGGAPSSMGGGGGANSCDCPTCSGGGATALTYIQGAARPMKWDSQDAAARISAMKSAVESATSPTDAIQWGDAPDSKATHVAMLKLWMDRAAELGGVTTVAKFVALWKTKHQAYAAEANKDLSTAGPKTVVFAASRRAYLEVARDMAAELLLV